VAAAISPLSRFLNIILPSPCPGCEIIYSEYDGTICPACSSTLVPAGPDNLTNYWQRNFAAKGDIDGVIAAYLFREDNPIREIIHQFKYKKLYRLARYMGTRIASSLSSSPAVSMNVILVPVPLHRMRRYERGYNQSLKLAEGMAELTGLQVFSKALKRNRYTTTQALLSFSERRKNIRGAFTARSELVQGKAILLIDDVITSGATMSECAKVLKAAGASAVYACSLAIVL
jgi:ComF family protein